MTQTRYNVITVAQGKTLKILALQSTDALLDYFFLVSTPSGTSPMSKSPPIQTPSKLNNLIIIVCDDTISAVTQVRIAFTT